MGTYLQFTPFSSLDLVGVALLSVVIYCFSLAIHRLYLSPLSAYPGPKLAGLTLWYEFYYDVIKRGKFAWEIKRMHEVYGSTHYHFFAQTRC
jgi:hypothetical protein